MPQPISYQSFIDAARRHPPRVAMILGSGLHLLARRIESELFVDYADIPAMAATSVAGHPGRLTLGAWAGMRVLVFEGRLHRYEGYSPDAIASPVRISRQLGAEILLATNSAGGIASCLTPPCLLSVTAHIDWNRLSFWREPNEACSHRPSPYSQALLEVMHRAADALAIPLAGGVYAQVTGPNYETPAEVRALKTCGADVVGMSTAIEIEAAQELGMQCAVISAVTNRAAGLSESPLAHEDVLAKAAALEQPLATLLERFLRNIT